LSKHVPLCTRILPSGKTCGSPALRKEKLCRHHIGRHRITERERYIRKMTERLIPELQAMSITQLLFYFCEKMERLQHTLKKYPDVHCALAVTMGRVHDIAQFESLGRLLIKQNQKSTLFGFGLNVVGILFAGIGHYALFWRCNDWRLATRVFVGIPCWSLAVLLIWHGASVLLGI
jgi:hypothetical protein